MSYLLIFCTVSLLILVHELGHFLAAKWMGIPIARFSVGLAGGLILYATLLDLTRVADGMSG